MFLSCLFVFPCDVNRNSLRSCLSCEIVCKIHSFGRRTPRKFKPLYYNISQVRFFKFQSQFLQNHIFPQKLPLVKRGSMLIPGIGKASVSYCHLMLAKHPIVFCKMRIWEKLGKNLRKY